MPPTFERGTVASYTVGVMTMDVEGRAYAEFHRVVEQAVARFDSALADEARLGTETLAFTGQHLTPGAGNYAPLDFLEIGLAEKLERRLPFLLIVTEVDLASSSLAYTLESWPGVGEATTPLEHLKLSMFLAAMGVLAGSLGGRSDSRDLVRGMLFTTEET